ncbi:MAG: hypothetical protein HQM16_15170 [Deltaproteobacteria bacterium]|nr:hypothetical protein [Deltaproteobacteria bacterium]
MKKHRTIFIRVLIVLLLFIAFVNEAQALEFSAHGYYRTRFEYTHDLDLQRPNTGIVPGDLTNSGNDRFGTIAFAQQRFRLNPHLKINDNISIHGQIDLLDNLLMGQSDVRALTIYDPLEGTISMSPANGPFGVIGPVGGDPVGTGSGNVNVRRLWVDILTSAGQIRIGRQPSHFGLGIFNNDGDSTEGDYGDTFDRLMYLASIGFNNGHRINFGLVYDYAYEASVDPSLDGLETGVSSNWNDAMQGGLILLYQGNSFEAGVFGGVRFRDGNDGQPTTTAKYVDNCGAGDGRPATYTCADPTVTTDPNYDLDNDGQTNDLIDLPAGVDGDTLIYIADAYAKFNFFRNYTLAFEGVYMGGKTAPGIAIDAIALDGASQATITNPLTKPIEVPLSGTQNDLQIIMGAMEFDAVWNFGGEFHIQSGYASGDDSPLSSNVTKLGFRPDYDIALILFDQPIGTSPALVIGGVTEMGRVPMSPNYINNAIYLTLEYKQGFDISSGIPWASDFKVGLKGISAIAPKNNLDLNLSEVVSAATGQSVTTLPHVANKSKWYGFEVDASVEATFFDALKWKTTIGAFVPGTLYDIKNANSALNATGIVDTILFDKAEIALAGKTTLYFEF